MQTDINKNNISENLITLERELLQIGLWDLQPIDETLLQSIEPFCVDRIRFEQWLQWVFIPKLSEMLSEPEFNGLPNKSDVYSMADYAFKSYRENTESICNTIKNIDNALNSYSIQTIH